MFSYELYSTGDADGSYLNIIDIGVWVCCMSYSELIDYWFLSSGDVLFIEDDRAGDDLPEMYPFILILIFKKNTNCSIQFY